MKRYCYVQALSCDDGELGTIVSFRHTMVEAADEDGAYAAGGRWDDETPLPWGFERLNDYVVEVEG